MVGWHNAHHHSPEKRRFVAISLRSFLQLWLAHVPIAKTLLSQFVDDIEDNFEELVDGMSGCSTPEDEVASDLVICAKKVAAFLSISTTVLRCLGPQEDPAVNPSFIKDT